MVLVAIGLTSPSLAQTGSPDPQWMVVQTDLATVRSGDESIYYTIAEFPRGTMVAVDGTSGDYFKVRYPAEMGVIVPASEATTTKAGTHIKLTKGSQLRAVSLLRGIDGSWCPVFPEELSAGTEMQVLETITDSESQVVGYRVAPPRPPVTQTFPYAFIMTDELRAATQAEIDAHQGGKVITTGRSPLAAGPNSTKMKAAQSEAEEATAVVIDQTPESSEANEELIDLREPMQIPTSTGQPVPDVVEEVPQVTINQPVEITNPTPVVVDPEKSGSARSSSGGARITVSDLESLESAFINARNMPRAQLDDALDELLAEFTRTRDSLTGDDSAIDPINQRIEWINIRMQTRDQRRAIAQALAAADQQSLSMGNKITEWNESRSYALVGRLVVSTVYTGEHLPLMYRVQAPDPITGVERTVGYVKPNANQDIRQYLGSVVGVVGNPVRDEALSMRVLSPDRIDRMPGQ